jgi:SPOC domain
MLVIFVFIFLQHYPIVWRGFLSLKNDQACVQMHFVHGSKNIALDSLPIMENGQPSLKIAQRMRLEPSQLEGVTRKIKVFCLLNQILGEID